MTTNDDQYVPSDEDMRWPYVVKRMHDGATRTHAEQEYTRWLAAHDARVRRDAAREALDRLAGELMEAARDCAEDGDHSGAGAWRNASAHTYYHRDTHYPEETP